MARSVVIGWFLALALLMLTAGEYLLSGLLAGAMLACNALMRDAKPFTPSPVGVAGSHVGSGSSGFGVGPDEIGYGTGGIGQGDEAAESVLGMVSFVDVGIDLQHDPLYHDQIGNIWRDSFIGDDEL